MISLEFAALTIRLGALVLCATCGWWIGGSLILALNFGYRLLAGLHVSSAFVLLVQFVVPGAVTWILFKYLWRHAEDLVTPPGFDAENWTDEPQGGQELLTAAMVLVGAYFLVIGARGLVESWFVYDLYRAGPGSSPFAGHEFYTVEAVRRFAIAGAEVLTSLMLIFAGRHIAARLQGAGT